MHTELAGLNLPSIAILLQSGRCSTKTEALLQYITRFSPTILEHLQGLQNQKALGLSESEWSNYRTVLEEKLPEIMRGMFNIEREFYVNERRDLLVATWIIEGLDHVVVRINRGAVPDEGKLYEQRKEFFEMRFIREGSLP